MLLALEVGNTNTVIGLYNGETLVADWRMETHRERMADEWAALIITLSSIKGYSLADMDAAICSSVVPPVTTALREMVERYLHTKLLLVEPGIKTGVKVNVDNEGDLAARFRVNSIPTLLVIKDGQEKGRLVGVQPKAKIAAAIDAA